MHRGFRKGPRFFFCIRMHRRFIRMETKELSNTWVLTHQPCHACGSSDAFSINDKGWGRCFACQHVERINMDDDTRPAPSAPKARQDILTDLTFTDLPARGLTEATCRKWSYGVSRYKGEPVQVAQYLRDGAVVAQKIRTRDKRFTVLGDGKGMGLYGQQLWSGSGKMIVITEGEIDALTVSQLQNNRWPVVSLPNGAQSAPKVLAAALEFLNGYDKIVLMFDQDSAGRSAVQAAAEVLPPGKAYVASLPLKDPNECLMAGKGDEVIRAIWDATPWRPDAVLNGRDLLERIRTYKGPQGAVWPFQGVQDMLPVMPCPGIVTLIAGTGSGKTTTCRTLARHLINEGENLGLMHLEEDVTRTALGIIGQDLGKRLDVTMDGADPAEIEKGFQRMMRDGVYLYDHFGSTEVDNVVGKVRYFAKSGRCRYVILDHLSIVVSGLEVQDERKAIDVAMTKLRTLVQETGICLVLVVHLRRRDGKAAENGGEVSLSDIRGSQAVAQLSDVVLALERDQQADGDARNLTMVRILKNRVTGMTGPACKLLFDPETGLQHEKPLSYSAEPQAEGDEFDAPHSTKELAF